MPAETSSTVRIIVRPRQYFDSVFLMRVSERLGHVPGVRDAAVVMATEANKARLADAGLVTSELATARPDDLVVALRADNAEVAEAAERELDMAFEAPDRPVAVEVGTLEDALSRLPSANIAVVSVPGEHAASEVRRAIDHGLHAFVFSGNVPVTDERALKEEAHRRGLLVMGPDCGTAIVRGIGLGFANAVRRGSVGVVGPSGTGMQEVTSLVHNAGAGVSHALGTGSHDTSDEVGGISTLDALGALASDEDTAAIVLTAKSIGAATRVRIEETIRGSRKPVIACVLNGALVGGAHHAATFEEAAALAVALAGLPSVVLPDPTDLAPRLARVRAALAPTQHRISGLFAGGSFARQAERLLEDAGVGSGDRAIVDLGAEELTRGRAHPMIDPRLRRERIAQAARDEQVAVILFDIVLGRNAAADPAGDLIPTIARALSDATLQGRHLAFVASVTGTDGDPQGRGAQCAALEDAGVIVLPTTARAARVAAALVGTGT